MSSKMRHCRYSDDIWYTILEYVVDKPSLARLSLVNDQLTRLAQPALFKSIKLDSEERANGLVSLIRVNSKLRHSILSLQIFSGYGYKSLSGSNPDIFSWVQSAAGGWTLRQLVALNELVLAETTVGSFDALDCVRNIALQTTGKITSLIIMNCRFAPVSKVAVIGALLNMLPDVVSFNAINNHLIDSNLSLTLAARLLDISYEFRQKKNVKPMLQRIFIGTQQHKLRNHIGAVSIADIDAWLRHSPTEKLDLQSLSVSVLNPNEMTALMTFLQGLSNPLKALRVHSSLFVNISHNPDLTPILDVSSISLKVQCAETIHIHLESPLETWGGGKIPMWVFHFLEIALPKRQRATRIGCKLKLEAPPIIWGLEHKTRELWNMFDDIASNAEQLILAITVIRSHGDTTSITEETVAHKLVPICWAQGKVKSLSQIQVK